MAGQLKNNLIFGITRLFFRFFNFIPRRIALLTGEFLGLAAALVLRKEWHKALRNLDRAFGQTRSYRTKRAIAYGCFITFGRALSDVMRLRKSYHSQIRPKIEVIGEEYFRKAYDRGRGVVAFTGHIGNFELLAAYAVQSGYKAAVIGRKLYDARLDSLLVENRRRMDIVNIYTDESPRNVMRYFKEGYAIGILIDTDSFRVGGELTPFFGRPAKTPTGPTQMGLITGAAFVPMFCLSLPGGNYRIIMGKELEIDSRERSRENVYRITCRMTRIIEDMIRAYPEQWIWMHNRWHTRPERDDLEFLDSVGMPVGNPD